MQNKTKKNDVRFFLNQIAMDIARIVCAVLIPFYRIKRLTPDGTPYKTKLKGGAIITANHTSFTDPFIVGVTFWYRRMNLLVAEIVMGNKLRSALLKGVGAIKIDRNATDLDAIKESIGVLKKGRLLAVFPQGGINREDKVDSIKSGAVLLALQSGVPIVPMYIKPRAHWYNRQTVVIGKVIEPKNLCSKKIPATADIEKITHVLADALLKCKNISQSED